MVIFFFFFFFFFLHLASCLRMLEIFDRFGYMNKKTKNLYITKIIIIYLTVT